MKNKKGFTLVELLAVIVILATIMLIGGLVVLPMIKKSKIETLGVEGLSTIDSAKKLYTSEMFKNTDEALFYSTDSVCVDIEYLYQQGYFDKGEKDKYTGSVYAKHKLDDSYEYYFWISDGTYVYTGATKDTYMDVNKVTDGGTAIRNCNVDEYNLDDGSDENKAAIKIITPFEGEFVYVDANGDTSNPLIIGGVLDPSADNSGFVPTNIVNGTFDSNPWMAFNYRGVQFTKDTLEKNNHLAPGVKNITNYSRDEIQTVLNKGQNFVFDNQTTVEPILNEVNEGWNSTENRIYNDGKLFDWTKATGGNFAGVHAIQDPYNATISYNIPGKTYSFIEMNAHEAAVFWQDLRTNSGDVIKWSLKHAVRPTEAGPQEQNIYVEIGQPNKTGGAYIFPHGIKSDLHTEINPSTSAKFSCAGIASPSNLGFGKLNELTNLCLNKVKDENGWYSAAGIYTVPEGQTLTRFSFVSDSEAGDGNLLDDITFSTLIGNLNVVKNDDGSATITGYWGEEDPSKRLIIIISRSAYKLDMVDHKGNFKVEVSEKILRNARSIQVYHQDYPQVKKEVTVR